MRTLQTSELITDEQSLVSAQFNHGTSIQTYDDGFGPLFILRDSMGVQGIIRAQSWEDAYSIAEDEMFPDCTETAEEITAEYGEFCEENPLFLEAYGFRPNGARSTENPMSFLYAKDLNGDALDLLTPEFAAELGITLNIQSNE